MDRTRLQKPKQILMKNSNFSMPYILAVCDKLQLLKYFTSRLKEMGRCSYDHSFTVYNTFIKGDPPFKKMQGFC